MIIVTGPRQVGKTTAVRQAIEGFEHQFIASDQIVSPELTQSDLIQFDLKPDGRWLIEQWKLASRRAKSLRSRTPNQSFVFVIDEVQKIPKWSEIVKGLWDAEQAAENNFHVVLLGSSPLLVQRGLTESLAGRYELIRLAHWSYLEMHQAFDVTLEEFLHFGGYPGAAKYRNDEARWLNYVMGSLVQPSIDKDILAMERVDKPALLKQLYEVGSSYSGQILSLNKVKGELDNAGNETTLAGYLNLLGSAGLLAGLRKYHIGVARQRASAPKMNVLNSALFTSATRYSFEQARADRTHWGRLTETAVGAHLLNTANLSEQVFYWRESPDEVDFVISNGRLTTAIEVKSGAKQGSSSGLTAFAKKFENCGSLQIGTGGVSLGEFFSQPLSYWLEKR